jgi:hypothetical protein
MVNLIMLLLFFTQGKPGALGLPGNKGAKGDMVISRVKGEHDQSLNPLTFYE